MISQQFIDELEGIVSSGQGVRELADSKWHREHITKLFEGLTEQETRQEVWEMLQRWAVESDGFQLQDWSGNDHSRSATKAWMAKDWRSRHS